MYCSVVYKVLLVGHGLEIVVSELKKKKIAVQSRVMRLFHLFGEINRDGVETHFLLKNSLVVVGRVCFLVLCLLAWFPAFLDMSL